MAEGKTILLAIFRRKTI